VHLAPDLVVSARDHHGFLGKSVGKQLMTSPVLQSTITRLSTPSLVRSGPAAPLGYGTAAGMGSVAMSEISCMI
jgi:hypothetical protein